MIIQSKTKPELLFPDMSFWVMTTDQTFTEISKKYKVLCPTILYSEILKCQRLFRPKFSKFKTSFFFEIREVSDTLTPNVDVSDDTPV